MCSVYNRLIKFIDETPASPDWKDSWFKHFWTDKNRKENFFEILPEYEDLKPMLIDNLKDKHFDISKEILIEVKNIYES